MGGAAGSTKLSNTTDPLSVRWLLTGGGSVISIPCATLGLAWSPVASEDVATEHVILKCTWLNSGSF